MLASLGQRTMGALHYEPADDFEDGNEVIDLASAALSAKQLMAHEHGQVLDTAIARGGATAGGMMPKVLAALNPQSGEIVTGAAEIPEDMQAWLIKLNTDEQKHASLVQLEHAYLAMAQDAGIEIPETRLIPDKDGLMHFGIRRFDRDAKNPNQRVHTQTYAALAGMNYKEPTSDYEDLLRLTKDLTRKHEAVCEQFKRMLFNVLAYNRDDHAKNFSFCMDDRGDWSLSPAYDLLFTENELGGNWMMVQGKRGSIQLDDIKELADLMSIGQRRLDQILDELEEALSKWPDYAKESGVDSGLSKVVETSIQNQISDLRDNQAVR